MAKDSKNTGRSSAKSGQYHVGRKSDSKMVAAKSSSKFYSSNESRGFSSKKDSLHASFVVGISPKGNYHGTTIIAETTDRPEWRMTAVEKMDMVREGVSKRNLESLKNKTNLDYDKLSTILSTTRATLINKKGTEHFSPALSERIVSIADLYSYGFDVFEDETKFKEWIFRPNQALGGRPPFELLDNQFGREEIKNVIGRINYGVYS